MKQYAVVKELLHLVQGGACTATRQVDSGTTETFLCIPGQYGPRWIIPANPKFGISVLEQWQPYNFLSKLKWRLLLYAYRFGVVAKFPGVTCVTINVETDMPEIPIIYIGTPGQQQKAVVILTSTKTCEPQRVMKIALGDKAKDSMDKEASILNALAQYTMSSIVPVLLDSAKNNEWTMQTVVQGHLAGRKLSESHIAWLLELPRSTKTTTLDEQQRQLQKMVTSCQILSINDKQDILQRLTNITGGSLPLVLVHGDFAPWNLKIQPDDKITAIDWEDAEFTGLPLWDLCHFFFIQGHLFNAPAPFEILKNNPLVRVYLEEMGLQQEQLLPLVLLYVLLMIIDQDRIVNVPYKEYLMQQVQLIA